MKTLLLTLVFILFTGLTNSTAQNTIEQVENQKIVTHLIGDHYSMTMYSAEGGVLQEGFYFKTDESFLEHGIWKLYDHNTYELVTKVKFDKGEKIWIETNIDGEFVRITQQDIEVNRLKNRISALEKQLADSDYK
ncbi:MAG: hypothetical protein JJ966_15075 [Balneolaceae bacterium]|nr:hypothetical protein [Balneolaceae bacterium]